MGRKIPGRKHHGVRDPEKQRALRLELQKVNAPPSNIDDQPIPKSVQRIAELINKTKNPPKIQRDAKKKKKTKGKKLIVVQTKVGINEKSVPKFEQKKGESDKAFLYRCQKMCENVIHEVDFEKKFGVAVERNAETGKIENTLKQKEEDPIKKMMKEARKEAKKKPKKKKKDGDVIKLSKSEKRKLKLKMKKEKKKEKLLDEFQPAERVKFGEVYHEPPVLTPPKLVEKRSEKTAPGQRNLLLKAIINGETPKKQVKEPFSKSLGVLNKIKKTGIDKKGKRKDLPITVRKQLERHQKEIIEGYKAMKAKNRKKI
ncbi:coiled-coil domain-containing protein 137 [Coccinella septempunctata]|uniref:coiled-coil domain-containing protein 137 n=1 Tax=Coccinella septempunctata TaxID=41139 RepID=UPI001D098F2A|nr:coiled-coil domain-containing protein 137 [Coccinella septempunctata]